jgi:glycosyltransferase involved in cell wall biosynthesis
VDPGLATLPSVSIVVPTHDRRELLARLLSRLDDVHRTGAPFEVVVVIDGSTDGTPEMLAARSPTYPLRVIAQEPRGAGAARNAGIRAAQGEVLLFLDDDVLPQDGLIEQHLAIHQGHPSAVVLGMIAAPPGRALEPWHDWRAAYHERLNAAIRDGEVQAEWRRFYTGNASVRRSDALAVGGFDESLRRAEDVEFAHRLGALGASFHFAPGALVYHAGVERLLESALRLMFEDGRSEVFLERLVGADADGFLRKEWPKRHLVNRALARWCVGHADRTRVVVSALSWIVTNAPAVPRGPRARICSVLFSVMYWAGVAEATGLGAQVWRDFIDAPPMPAPAGQAATDSPRTTLAKRSM